MSVPKQIGTPTLRQILEDSPLDPWDVLATYIPLLKGRTLANLGTAGELLKTFLLTSLCCERPPLSESWYRYYGERSRYYEGGPLLDHEEKMWAWGAYYRRLPLSPSRVAIKGRGQDEMGPNAVCKDLSRWAAWILPEGH